MAFYIFTVTGHFRKFKDNGKTSRVRKVMKGKSKKSISVKIFLVNLLQKNFLKSLKKKTLDGHFSATAATAVEEVFHLILTILHDSMKSQEK